MMDFISNIEWGLKGLSDVANIHPLFVHFPIALLLTSFAAYLLGSIIKREELLVAGKWLLFFGTIAAAVTVWTGLEAEKTVSHGGGVHEIMIVHKYFGYTVLGLSVFLSSWVLFSKAHIPSKGRIVFLATLAFLAMVLTQGADLGGRMVFLHGTGVGGKDLMAETMPHDHAQEHGGAEDASQEHAGEEHGGQEHGGEEDAGHEDDHGDHHH